MVFTADRIVEIETKKNESITTLTDVNHHKYLVMKECFEVGLYKQGLLHDMSKYSPTEFLVGCKYYQGNRVRIMRKEKQPDIPRHGFIIKDGISIIINTVFIIV